MLALSEAKCRGRESNSYALRAKALKASVYAIPPPRQDIQIFIQTLYKVNYNMKLGEGKENSKKQTINNNTTFC